MIANIAGRSSPGCSGRSYGSRSSSGLVVFEGGRLVAVSVAFPPGRCRPRPVRSARLGLVVASFGPPASVRVARWQLAWRRRDPPAPHDHLALLAVRPEAQCRGRGQMLLTAYCRGLNERGEGSCLETDRLENLRFYGRHGFIVAAEADVLGVRNWFLHRPPVAALEGERDSRFGLYRSTGT